VLVHAAPTLNTLYWSADRSDEFCLKMAEHAGLKRGDAIAFGHTHVPWHREVEGIHFVNTGSVGRPKDGDWRAGYVLLDIGTGPLRVEIVRVAYDVERAARGVLESELPNALAEYLRGGGAVQGQLSVRDLLRCRDARAAARPRMPLISAATRVLGGARQPGGAAGGRA
jgi:hypothetical protein